MFAALVDYNDDRLVFTATKIWGIHNYVYCRGSVEVLKSEFTVIVTSGNWEYQIELLRRSDCRGFACNLQLIHKNYTTDATRTRIWKSVDLSVTKCQVQMEGLTYSKRKLIYTPGGQSKFRLQSRSKLVEYTTRVTSTPHEATQSKTYRMIYCGNTADCQHSDCIYLLYLLFGIIVTIYLLLLSLLLLLLLLIITITITTNIINVIMTGCARIILDIVCYSST